MWFEVTLAIGAALVAIVGTLHDPKADSNTSMRQSIKRVFDPRNVDRKLLAPRLLILSAITICVIAMFKAYDDNTEKEFIKSVVVETLNPTPDVISKVADAMQSLLEKEGYTVDYGNSDYGMVFYLTKPNKSDGGGEGIILSNSDLAKLYASVILKEGTSTLLRKSLKQTFDFKKYNEDLYSRLCALFVSSVRRVLYKKPVDCDHDEIEGITLTINVNNIEQQVIFSVPEIKKYAGKETKSAFGQMDQAFRQKVREVRDNRSPG